MKKSRFTEEQIIGILREHEAGLAILRWSQEAGVGVALHRARQAHPERLHREFQRKAAGRTAERDAVLISGLCPRGFDRLEGRLQHCQAAQRHRQRAAGHLRQSQRSRNATGRVA